MLIRTSKPTKKIPDGNFNCLCDAQQSFNGDNFFSTFNLADIFRVQIHSFSQRLLSETGFFAIQPDGIADNFPVPKNRLFLPSGHAPKIADTSLWLTPATCWYFALVILFMALKVPNIVIGV
ncbi:MAG TPA: hypothetical protein VGY56_03710 [Verrucomicrobiae bacterium]|nr:hypothetical protein [Verrucomicrobiae bacterium]